MDKLFRIFTSTLLAAAPPQVAAQAPTKAQPIVLSSSCAGEQRSLDEAAFVPIGEISQWITIKGGSCANPIVLVIHGGPGNPNTPYADAIFGSWTKDFTVVQWDQRGAGKTYAANRPSEDQPLTIKQMTRDGVEVTRYLTARLGKRKVILMGSSWGSALAVHMTKAEPGLFHAYLGTGQLVGGYKNLNSSYRRVLPRARAGGDRDTVRALEAIGPPPWINPRAFGVLRRATRRYEAPKTDPAPSEWWRSAVGYDSPSYRADYEAGEEYSYLQFVGLTGGGILSQLDLYKLGPSFEMPVFLIHGEEDLVTTPEVAKAYFDSVKAPRKAFILLARTGHDPNQTMIGAQLSILKTRVRAEAMAFDEQ